MPRTVPFRPFILPVLSALILGPVTARAQPVESATFGDRSLDRGVHIVPLDGGGFAVTGIWQEEGRGDDDVLLAVLGSDGDVIWRVAHGGAQRDWGWNVMVLSDGGFLVAGTTASSGSGLHDMMLLRADREGRQLWRKAYGGSGEEYAWSGVLMPDGGVVMVGETTTDSAGERDIYLVRTDAEGALLWEERRGGAGDDRLFSVARRADGDLVAVGLTTSRGAGEEDALLVTFSPDGEILRTETLGEGGLDIAHHITPVPDGFLVTGYTGSYGADLHDPWVIRMDRSGNVTGHQVIGMPGVNRTLTGCLTREGAVALTGFTLDEQELTRVLTVRLDPDGSDAVSRGYALSENSLGYGVCAAPGGGFAVIGHTVVPGQGLQVFFLRDQGR